MAKSPVKRGPILSDPLTDDTRDANRKKSKFDHKEHVKESKIAVDGRGTAPN